ncbi:unnamed protein product [Mytilus edulis]|uniref:Uncharacterized protein n=1 Tax=Mytilus edulis TaxID=6550 RepID=A0A8S3VDF9_MYTED|nr:unnamed protein product [Mytilus edulis]
MIRQTFMADKFKGITDSENDSGSHINADVSAKTLSSCDDEDSTEDEDIHVVPPECLKKRWDIQRIIACSHLNADVSAKALSSCDDEDLTEDEDIVPPECLKKMESLNVSAKALSSCDDEDLTEDEDIVPPECLKKDGKSEYVLQLSDEEFKRISPEETCINNTDIKNDSTNLMADKFKDITDSENDSCSHINADVSAKALSSCDDEDLTEDEDIVPPECLKKMEV